MEKFKPSFKHGLIMGGLSILLFLLQWALAPDSFGSMSGWIITLVLGFLALPILFMILGTRDSKKNFEKFNYGNALKAAFFVGLVSALLVLVFNVIFSTVIDSGFDDRIKEKVMENIRERMENSNMADEQIEEVLSQQETRFEKNKGIIGKVKQTGYGLIWYLILGLIIALVYRDKKSETDQIIA